jgi:DeoR/GlpR family transcriptional regulator of sugar metabolism
MLRNANKTFALVNSSNLNTTEHYKVCDIKDISGMITDLATDDSKLDDFRHLGIRLI